MQKTTPDQTFELETAAKQYAATISKKKKLRWNIILTGDFFFVTTSKNIQSYEKLVGSYLNGRMYS